MNLIWIQSLTILLAENISQNRDYATKKWWKIVQCVCYGLATALWSCNWRFLQGIRYYLLYAEPPATLLYLTYNLPLSKVCKPTRSRSYSYFTCNPIKHQVKLMHDWPSDLLPIFGLKNRRCICRSRFSLGHKYTPFEKNRPILETSTLNTFMAFMTKFSIFFEV
jgi:hypothetical protein